MKNKLIVLLCLFSLPVLAIREIDWKRFAAHRVKCAEFDNQLGEVNAEIDNVTNQIDQTSQLRFLKIHQLEKRKNKLIEQAEQLKIDKNLTGCS